MTRLELLIRLATIAVLVIIALVLNDIRIEVRDWRPTVTEVHHHKYDISHRGILNLYDENYAKINEGK